MKGGREDMLRVRVSSRKLEKLNLIARPMHKI